MDEPKLTERFTILAAAAEAPFSGAISIFADPGMISSMVTRCGLLVRLLHRGSREDGPVIFKATIALVSTAMGSWLRAVLIDFQKRHKT